MSSTLLYSVYMEIQLRPYQNDAITNLKRLITNGERKIILRSPTGSGKTIIAAQIIRGASKKGSRVLFLAHRQELITQCSEKLSDINVEHGIIKAGIKPDPLQMVQVGSVQTVVNREIERPKIIIIDECHRARANSYTKIVDRFPKAVVLGLTATPCRTDGKGLGAIFNSILPTIEYDQLIEQKYLVSYRVFAPPLNVSLAGIKKTGGDFNKKEMNDRLAGSKIYGDVLKNWKRLASDRSTLIFCPSIVSSEALTNDFINSGIKAAHLDGTTPAEKRNKIISDLKSGIIQVVCNVGICTEGTDIPVVSCIVLARPTCSLSLHQQMIGRGLRIHPESNKRDCIIIDHVSNHNRLGMISDEIEWSLDGEKKAGLKEKAVSVRLCPSCFLSLRGGAYECPSCGYIFEGKGKVFEVVNGELVEFKPKPIYHRGTDPLTYFVRKLDEGIKMGYKKGWAANKYKFLFKSWPKFSQMAIEQRRKELSA